MKHQDYHDEDGFLSDKELEECIYTEYYSEDKWKEISSEEYLALKRKIIPEENDFVDVRLYENLHILRERIDLITDEGEYKNAQFTEEEIESLLMEWKKYLLKIPRSRLRSIYDIYG